MNHSFIHKLLGLTLLVGVVLAVATPSHAAERVRQRHATTVKTANGRTTTGSVTGERGKASTFRSTTAHHGSGVTTRATTLTGPRGKSTERELSRQINADGTGIRTVEITKPDGTRETHTQTFTIVKEPAPTP